MIHLVAAAPSRGKPKLLNHIHADEKLTAFVELESAVRAAKM